MPRLSTADQRALRALDASLGTWSEGAQPALAALMPELQRLLRAEHAVAYLLEPQPREMRLRFLYAAGPQAARMQPIFAAWLRGRTGAVGAYDPAAPERAQRNVPLELSRLPRSDRPVPIAVELFPRVDLDGRDQLRVLVCEGASLLAWVGGFRREPFAARERELLGRLVGPLRRRLALERRLGDAVLNADALAAALEALGAAAFIVDGAGGIRHANASGRALVERDARAVGAALAQAVDPAARGRFSVTAIRSRGLGAHYLAVERATPVDGATKVAAAARRWQLTPRQTEVLRLVARGAANKTIADTLGCAERTVELHVTAIFAKAEVDGRAALVARLWSGF